MHSPSRVFCLFVTSLSRFVCPIEFCDKAYRTQWELNFHCRKKHSPDTPKKFACCYNECGIEFATNNDLTAHYESMHTTTSTTSGAKNEKRKPKLKRAAPSTNARKSTATSKPKIIYVLPGPVEKTVSSIVRSLAESYIRPEHFLSFRTECRRRWNWGRSQLSGKETSTRYGSIVCPEIRLHRWTGSGWYQCRKGRNRRFIRNYGRWRMSRHWRRISCNYCVMQTLNATDDAISE